ncbi:hypothetical protein [Lactococcus lactis]|uniref:hypothetical protein n=1 Tax=Lactococcus lactis TaxID=1358 RepID=UPI0020749252|nr:hypothetical protein [Lactococcus lactis]
MSELEKAKQIAAEAFNFKSKAYTTIEQQNEIIEVNRKAFMQILSLSSLTIPQSIADMLYEELNPLKRESMIETFVLGVNYLVLSDELMKFVITGDNYHVISAYLAGKALGVELVKVVEG